MVLLLQREPRFTPFSLQTNNVNNDKYDITSLAHLRTHMMQCCRCKVQYVGETKRHRSDRFGKHRRAIKKAIKHHHIDQPTAVSDHLTLPGHSVNDIPLELTNSIRDGIRKARKAFSISKGKSLEPSVMNRRDET